MVAPFPPRLAATHGGAKIIGQVLDRSAERHAVALVYLRHEGEPPLEDELRSRLDLAEEILRPSSAPTTPGHYVRAFRRRIGLLTGTPLHASELWLEEAFTRLRDVAHAWRPDVIRIEYPVMGSYLGAVADVPAVRMLIDHDPLLETARFSSSPAARLEHRLDVGAWRRFRRRVLATVDAAVVPTERDRTVLRAVAGATEVVCIPWGTDVDTPALDPAGSDDDGLLFVGNLNHVPNRDSARFLAFDVLPRVRRGRPDSVLRLVGEGTETFGDVEGVEAAGGVPDVTPFLDAAAVVVAPARLGGGMRVKVAEALVAGKAVVATPLAIEGFTLEPGRHAVVVESAELAEAVSSLLADRERRIELGRNAREWALANLGWERVLDDYDALYRRLVSRGARARS